jgi:leucine-rich repeat protein SHOC2
MPPVDKDEADAGGRIKDIHMKAVPFLLAALLLAGGCSPREQFWQKPDFGQEYTNLAAATSSAGPVRNLDLYNQGLTAFPPEALQLDKLERLSLRKNALGAIPESIGALKALYWLDLGQAGLASLPAGIGQLPAVRLLYLNDNQLTALPPEIGGLSKLEYLNLDRNKLTEIPPGLCRLPALKWLRLKGNQVKTMPADLGTWPATLRRLYLQGNPLSDEEKARLRKALPNCTLFF